MRQVQVKQWQSILENLIAFYFWCGERNSSLCERRVSFCSRPWGVFVATISAYVVVFWWHYQDVLSVFYCVKWSPCGLWQWRIVFKCTCFLCKSKILFSGTRAGHGWCQNLVRLMSVSASVWCSGVAATMQGYSWTISETTGPKQGQMQL